MQFVHVQTHIVKHRLLCTQYLLTILVANIGSPQCGDPEDSTGRESSCGSFHTNTHRPTGGEALLQNVRSSDLIAPNMSTLPNEKIELRHIYL